MVDFRARRWFRVLALLAILALAVPLLAACGDDDDGGEPTVTAPAGATATTAGETPAPATPTEAAATATTPADTATATTPAATATAAPASPTASTPAEETMVLSVFFIRDEKVATAHRALPRTEGVAAAAMQALLEGPTDAEAELGMSTAIPEGTAYNGIAIEDTVATVDLSSEFESGGGSFSMAARLAQVVYTLTQFPTIETVRFALDGEPVEVFGGEGLVMDHPVGRADYEELTPPVLVLSHAPFDVVESPLRITGTANTFEATFQLRVLAEDGTVLYDNFVTATSGTGTRGTFDVTVGLDVTGDITLRVFEYSAKDGSEINIVEIPLTVE